MSQDLKKAIKSRQSLREGFLKEGYKFWRIGGLQRRKVT